MCSKWPNSPNFPSAAGGLLDGGGAALRPATASAAPRSRLAGKWVSVQRTAVQPLYTAHRTPGIFAVQFIKKQLC